MGRGKDESDFCLTKYGQDLAARYYRLALAGAYQAAKGFGIDYQETSSLMGPIYLKIISRIGMPRDIDDEGYIYNKVRFKVMEALRFSADSRRSKRASVKRRIDFPRMESMGDGGRSAAKTQLLTECLELLSLVDSRKARMLELHFAHEYEWQDVGREFGISRHMARYHANEAMFIIRAKSCEIGGAGQDSGFVEHPDWPGYGLDRRGQVWSTSKGIPKMLVHYNGIRINTDKKTTKISYAEFVDTHPLRDVILSRKAQMAS